MDAEAAPPAGFLRAGVLASALCGFTVLQKHNLKRSSIAIENIENHWLKQKFKGQEEKRFKRRMYFSEKKKKRTAFLVPLYLTGQGVIKYYGNTCAF